MLTYTDEMKLVYVDDDVSVRHVVSELLRLAGVEVHDFATGEAALKSIVTNVPDVVLVDLDMPEMDGFEVARRIRTADAGLRIVAFSGKATFENRRKAADSGFDRFISKPASTEALLAALHGH